MTISTADSSGSAPDLRSLLPRIPTEPGVYRFLGADREVLYVGKAKDLRKRVSSYFRRSGTPHGRTPEMLTQAHDIEWVVTASEGEALLLEENFIKEHRPRYNLLLRDDKSYPSIEVTLRDEWPRVRLFRGRRVRGNLYFGPYPSASKAREVIEILGRIFPYRKCRGAKPGRRNGSPCLQYFIKRSLAPCDHRVTREEYLRVIDQVVEFLRGRLSGVERGIEREMAAAVVAQEFEKAAILRDRLVAVQHVRERQTARIEGADVFDVIGLYQTEPGANAQVFCVRGGAVVDRRVFYVENADGRAGADVLEEFLLEYYWEGSAVPPEIVVPIPEVAEVAEILAARRGAGVNVYAPQRGAKRRLLDLAQRNAELSAVAEAERLASRSSARIEALERLRDVLGLPSLPLRIECYDISNLGESYPVGSMTVLEGGLPKKAHYRRFAVRDVVGQDDFAMMEQVLRRRFERRDAGEAHDESFAATPDLIVVDGGKGQLSAACTALASVGVGPEVAVVGLAKQREEVFVPGATAPLPLAADDPASLLLQRVRDEAHRFAVTYHRKRRAAALPQASVFDGLPQVGPVRRRRILEHFGSPEAFLAASREELERVPGLPRKIGREIYAHLHKVG